MHIHKGEHYKPPSSESKVLKLRQRCFRFDSCIKYVTNTTPKHVLSTYDGPAANKRVCNVLQPIDWVRCKLKWLFNYYQYQLTARVWDLLPDPRRNRSDILSGQSRLRECESILLSFRTMWACILWCEEVSVGVCVLSKCKRVRHFTCYCLSHDPCTRRSFAGGAYTAHKHATGHFKAKAKRDN